MIPPNANRGTIKIAATLTNDADFRALASQRFSLCLPDSLGSCANAFDMNQTTSDTGRITMHAPRPSCQPE